MASGNALLNRLVRAQAAQADAYPPRPHSSAVEVKGANALTFSRAVGCSTALVGLTLVAAVAAWIGMTRPFAGTGDWPGAGANLAGVIGAVLVVALIVFGSFRPLMNPLAGVVFAVAQGVLLAWLGTAFDPVVPGLFVNGLFGTALAGLAVLLVARTRLGRLAALLSASGAAIAALALAGVAGRAAGSDTGLFGSGDGFPWHVWVVILILVPCAAYAFGVDVDVVKRYAEAGAPARHTWAAAVGVTAGLTGMYAWRFFAGLTKGYSDGSPSGASDDGYTDGGGGSDSGGSSD
jgi:uncharacterized YccA/Bax inhibitor family protein